MFEPKGHAVLHQYPVSSIPYNVQEHKVQKNEMKQY